VVASAAPVTPSKTVRYSGPVRILPRVVESRLIQSALGSPMTLPLPSTVPSAVLPATSALPSPSKS
jgi:hypothetical protein